MASTIIGGSQVATVSGSGIHTPRNTYSTIRKLRKYLTLASADTSDDDQLKEFLRVASRAIDGYCERQFYPEQKTLYYDLPQGRNQLTLYEDILEVKGLSDLNGASEIDSNVYWLKTGDLWNVSPYDRIILDDSSGSVFNYIGTPRRAVHVEAIRGFHDDYDNAWVDSGASLVSSVTSTQEDVTVSGSLGINIIGEAPRFEEGQIWRIDEEYFIAASGLSTSQVRTVRGMNGTTAASHAASATVYVYDPVKDIEFATRRLAAMEYHQSFAPYTGRVVSLQFGTIENHDEWPPDVKGRIDRYRRRRLYSV